MPNLIQNTFKQNIDINVSKQAHAEVFILNSFIGIDMLNEKEVYKINILFYK